MVSNYEKQRELNIAKNKDVLRMLGLEGPTLEPREKIPHKIQRNKKRKAEALSQVTEANEQDGSSAKFQAAEGSEAGTENKPLRRSSRNVGKKVDYSAEISTARTLPLAYSSGVKTSDNDGPLGREAGAKRLHDPKVYGHIPGIEVGTWWETRQGCSADAVHAPWVGGISGGPNGAHSIVLSGGYDDDVDLGYAFTYTGSGGRDLKGTKAAPKNLRTAPQSCDQTFDNNFNRMLQRSCETKNPVRVVRGFKGKSCYAPTEGYRYDGLYRVEKAWIEPGLNPKGYLVCKYAFKRLPNQPPIPINGSDDKDEVITSNE
ncbi:PUA-like domain-containing protein [Cyathus striatus]|nr:PUA-like domain-containing protein [Cyathus striatus]